MAKDPRRTHPEFTPTDPPPRGVPGIPGLRLPANPTPKIEEKPKPEVQVEVKSDGHAEAKSASKKPVAITISAGAVAAIIAALSQILGSSHETEKPPPAPIEQCASQATVDQMQSRITDLEKQVKVTGEAVCALNGGPFGSDWPECPPHVYYTPRESPPLKRTDRSYPK